MYDKNLNKYVGFIYLMTNNINGKYYVGQTRRSIRDRMYAHKANGKRNNCTCIIDLAIQKYGIENFTIDTLENIQEDTNEELKKTLNKLEIFYIEKYKSLVKDGGYNITKGGNFVSNTSCTPVDQYSIEGKFIKSWNSMSEAVEKLGLTKNASNNISRVCSGGTMTAHGFVWRYKGEPLNKYKYNDEVYCFDLDGNFIKKYYSMSDIISDYGKSITSALDNPRLQLCNRWWSTKPEFEYTGRNYAKSIDLYDKFGNLIQTFDSMLSCAKYIDTDICSVSDLCIGKRKSVNGYIARYRGNRFEKFNTDKNIGSDQIIDVYDINKVYICSFKNFDDMMILDGLPRELFRLKDKVKRCCEGNVSQHNGYIFRYRGEDVDKYDSIIKIPKDSPINQYTLDGDFIASFENINDVIKFYNNKSIKIDHTSIGQCCRGKSKSSYGFKWFYQFDLNNPDKSRIRTRLNQENPKAIEYINNQRMSKAS